MLQILQILVYRHDDTKHGPTLHFTWLHVNHCKTTN